MPSGSARSNAQVPVASIQDVFVDCLAQLAERQNETLI